MKNVIKAILLIAIFFILLLYFKFSWFYLFSNAMCLISFFLHFHLACWPSVMLVNTCIEGGFVGIFSGYFTFCFLTVRLNGLYVSTKSFTSAPVILYLSASFKTTLSLWGRRTCASWACRARPSRRLLCSRVCSLRIARINIPIHNNKKRNWQRKGEWPGLECVGRLMKGETSIMRGRGSFGLP